MTGPIMTWARDHLPNVALRTGPLGVLVWQWLALPVILLIALGVGSIASRMTRRALRRLVTRTSITWDDKVLASVGAPLTVALTLLVASGLLPWIEIVPTTANAIHSMIRAVFFADVFWAAWRLVDIARQTMLGSHWALASAPARALIPLGARVTKVMVLAVAAVSLLAMLGFEVAGLIAGLGLGGLAFALAAQKTVENLFGAFSIGVDQPFREGDFVKIEEFVATVESIGLRSTRFRTLDRTIITIPNGRLADMRLESFTVRDRLRLSTVIGLEYQTTRAQMREVLAGFESVLRGHPKIWPGAVVVRFREFAPSSLDIEIMAWFTTSDWPEFQLIRQEILLQFMDVVERAGTSFAFPTQTLHVASMPKELERWGEASPRA